MRRKRFSQFLKAWLFPLRHINDAAGWLQVLWLIALFLLPAGIGGAISRVASGSWTSRWFIVGLLGGLLLLALCALWRATPRSALTVTFDRAHVQTPAVVDQGKVVAQSRYFHFQVHSEAPVRQCEARLIRVEREVSGGGYEMVPEFKPPVHLTLDSVEGLRWPLIEPQLPARINLILSQSNVVGGAMLCVPSHAPHGNLTTLLQGKYRLTVRVSAEGVEDVEGRFIVRVTGMWSGLDVAVD